MPDAGEAGVARSPVGAVALLAASLFVATMRSDWTRSTRLASCAGSGAVVNDDRVFAVL